MKFRTYPRCGYFSGFECCALRVLEMYYKHIKLIEILNLACRTLMSGLVLPGIFHEAFTRQIPQHFARHLAPVNIVRIRIFECLRKKSCSGRTNCIGLALSIED